MPAMERRPAIASGRKNYFLRSSPLAKARSVAAGTSPTTVTHQSPCWRIKVCVAPMTVSMGLTWRSRLKGSMKTDT